LGDASPSEFANGEKLDQGLVQLLSQGFTQIDGAIVFTATRSIAKKVKPENFPDLTGFECFVNNIHVEDQLEEPLAASRALLKQGVAFGLATERQLRSTFPGKPFKVIIGATERGCGARFHLARPGEEWLASNLDGYGDEAILVLET
jgi:hypothetical protein